MGGLVGRRDLPFCWVERAAPRDKLPCQRPHILSMNGRRLSICYVIHSSNGVRVVRPRHPSRKHLNDSTAQRPDIGFLPALYR